MRTIKTWGGIFVVVVGLFIAMPAFAASLSIVPSSGTYYVGRSFTVDVDVSSADQAMNAAAGTISFPIGTLQVISISRANSIMTLWVQPPSFSNNDGVINFQGIAVNPGFQGNAGQIIAVTFLAKSAGSASLSFLSGSVLANDGKGTNITDGMQGANITVAPAPLGGGTIVGQNALATTITSDPAVSSGTWYNFNNIAFNWNIPAGATGVNYAISTNPQYQLAQTSQGLISATSYNLSQNADGKWYFLVSFESGATWSAPSVKEFDIDRTPPDPFVIVPENNGDLTDARPAFQWAATDKTSGIADYQIRIGDGNWFEASTIQEGSSYVLPYQSPTNSRILTVRAFDKAGNFTDSSISFQVLLPGVSCGNTGIACRLSAFFTRWDWLIVIIFFLILLIACVLIYELLGWKKESQKELQAFKNELQSDLKKIEGKIKEANSTEVDLRRSKLLEEEHAIEKQVRHIAGDVKEEIEHLKDKK